MYLLFQQSSADVFPPRASAPRRPIFLHSVCGTPRFQTIVLGFAWGSGPPVHKSGIKCARTEYLKNAMLYSVYANCMHVQKRPPSSYSYLETIVYVWRSTNATRSVP